MRFAFDEQQLEFRSQLRGFLERECTAADVRAAFDAACSGSRPQGRKRWEQLAAMGVVGLAVPESEGGLGLGAVDLVGLLEEAGRALSLCSRRSGFTCLPISSTIQSTSIC